MRDHVATLSTIHADKGTGWDALHASWETKRVSRSVRFYDKGACTNQTESNFSRLRRMEIGTHDNIAGPYPNQHAGEAFFRKDHRRVANGDHAAKVEAMALAPRPSHRFAGC